MAGSGFWIVLFFWEELTKCVHSCIQTEYMFLFVFMTP